METTKSSFLEYYHILPEKTDFKKKYSFSLFPFVSRISCMKKKFLSFLFTCFLLSGCSNTSENKESWDVLPPNAANRMLSYAAELCKISPRDAGTPGAAKASRWLVQTIQAMGAEPIVDCWIENTLFGKTSFCNVYVDFPGTSGQTIILASHYDTKQGIPNFQGANDGASSTGMLLGLIECFLKNPPQVKDTIRFAFLDGEECRGGSYKPDDGLHGSNHLAEYYASLPKTPVPLLAFILFDMIGDRDLAIDLPRNVTPWLGKAAMIASHERKDCPTVSLETMVIIDDHLPFLNQGFSAIDFIDFTYGSKPGSHDYWHTSEDSIDKISAKSLQQAGTLALALLARIEKGTEVPKELRPEN